jgi:hypothetical protein
LFKKTEKISEISLYISCFIDFIFALSLIIISIYVNF